MCFSHVKINPSFKEGDKLIAGQSIGTHVTREQMVISKSARDADPLKCTGEAFDNAGQIPNWVDLK